MGWVSAIGKQVAKAADQLPVAPVAAAVEQNAGPAALGGAVGAALPADTTEERLANMVALAGGAVTARTLVRAPKAPTEAERFLEPPGTEVMGIFGGISSRQAPLPKLERAKTLEAAGADAKSIWSETGWLRGEEGAWKYEIDDSKAQLIIDPPKMSWEFDLEELFSHDELFAAYPELKKTQIMFKDMGPVGRDAEGNIIQGATGAYDRFFKTVIVNNRLTREEAAEAIVHEVQHNVQQVEGFARGGSPKAGKEFWDTPQIERAIGRLGDLKLKHDRATDPAQKKIIKTQMDTLKAAIQAQAEIEYYKRLPGEVEARLAETRRTMSAEQRAGVFPKDQYDVAAEELLPTPQMRTAMSETADPEIRAAVEDSKTDVLELTSEMEVLNLDEFIAFHGTLAKFDEFKLEKVGSGEGAQAFGPGHYFTQSRGIAEWYRKRMKTLAPGIRLGKEEFNKANPEHFALSEYWRWRDRDLYGNVFGGDKPFGGNKGHFNAIEQAIWALEFEIRQIEDPATYPGGVVTEYATADRPVIKDRKELIKFLEAGIAYLKTLDPESSKGIPKPSKRLLRGGGNIYTVAVKLPADATIQYDLPFGKQSEKVKAAFRAAAERGALGKGADVLAKYGDETRMDVLVASLKGTNTEAMQIMREMGVRGLRYLDGFSRGKRNKKGQTFNYVAFNDSDVKVLDREGKMFSERGGPLDEIERFETPGSPEWEAAKAKGLDMSQAGRLARAKEMGFDTETVLYHGTASDVDAFKVGGGQGSQSNEGALGVWLTPDPKVAETFSDFAIPRKADGSLNADAQGRYLSGSNIMPVYSRLKNPKVYEAVDGKDPYLLMQLDRQKHVKYVSGANSERTAEGKLKWAEDNTQQATAAFRKELQDQGYDGVIIRRTEYDAVDAPTDQVIIFDPSNIRSVNAAFDPDNAGSANLLASQRGGPLDEMADDALDVPPEEPGLSLAGRVTEAALYAGGAAAAGGAIGIGMGWDGIQRTEPEKPPEDMTPAEFARWKAQEEAVMRAEMAARGQTREEAPVAYNPLPVTPEAEQNMAQTEEMLAIRRRNRRGAQ